MAATVAAATLLLLSTGADALPSADSMALTCDAEKAAAWNAENGVSPNYFTMGASDNLRASKVAFDTLNVNFFLAEGSLLGWYRNCMPIPWDTDLDLGVMMEDLGEGEKADAKLEEIKTAMADQGFAFSRPVGSRSEGLTLVFDRKGVRTDIHFFYRNDETNEFYINILDGPTSYKNSYKQFEVRAAEAFGVLVAVPYPAQEYLATTYGDFMRKRTSERGTGEGTAGWNLESPLNANVTRRRLEGCDEYKQYGQSYFCYCKFDACFYSVLYEYYGSTYKCLQGVEADMYKCVNAAYNASATWYNGRRYSRYQYCDSCQYTGTPKYCANQTEAHKCMADLAKEAENPAFNHTACWVDPKVAAAAKKCESDSNAKSLACQKAYLTETYPNNPCMGDVKSSAAAGGASELSWTLIGAVLASAAQLGY